MDGRTDGQTELSSLDRVYITCSAVKIDTDDDNFTYMHSRPLKGRKTKVCVWGKLPDVITQIKFDVDRFRGSRSLMV